jgi:hypothetical protein
VNNQCIIYLGLALVLSSAASQAEPIRLAQAGVIPPAEILSIVRSAGFRTIGRPARDGANYVLRAIDRRGDDVQVIVDAEDAEILYVRRLRGPTGFAAPRGQRYPDFYDDVPRPPRSVPAARATPPAARAAAGPPIPRARPSDVTGSITSAPTATVGQPAPAPAPAAAPAKTEVPPVVGFE